MELKEIFKLYDIEKNGVYNGNTHVCVCGETTEANKCPKCGRALTKGTMVNLARKTPVKYRNVTIRDDEKGLYTFQRFMLVGRGTALEESLFASFTINTRKHEITTTSEKVFKAIERSSYREEAIAFVESVVPGLYDYIASNVNMDNEWVSSSMFGAPLTNLNNVLYFFGKYNALLPYCASGEVFYQGKRFSLEEYFPGLDFNDKDTLNKINFNPKYLRFLDFKKCQFIKTIIKLSEDPLKDEMDKLLDDLIHKLRPEARVTNSFSVLFNEEISVEDFIRIYKNSDTNSFLQMDFYAKMKKRYEKKAVKWDECKGISKKDISKFFHMEEMRTEYNPLKISEINEIMALVDENPMEALRLYYSHKN